MDLKEIIQQNSLFNASTLERLTPEEQNKANGVKWIIDLRSILLDSKICYSIAEKFWEFHANDFDLQIATMELAGVPLLAAIMAVGHHQGRYCTGLVVRKSPKKSGLFKVIEGTARQNIKTIVVDDIINSGASVEKCLLNLAEIGISCTACFSIISYGTKFFDKIALKYRLTSNSVFRLDDFKLKLSETPQSFPDLSGFTTVWVADPKLTWNQRIIFCKSTPLFSDGIVYWGTDANVLFATNSQDGAEIWRHTGPMKSFLKGIWSSPCSDSENVYFGSYDGGLYALSKKSGLLVWESNIADFIGSSPVLAQDLDLIFIGQEFASSNNKGAIAGINRLTGELVWQFKTNLHVHSSPMYSKRNGLVFCGSNDSDMICLDAKTGILKWRMPINGIVKMAAALSPDETLLFAGSLDGCLYVFETLTGNILWKFQSDKGILASPLVVNELVFVASCDNCIYILDYLQKKVMKKINSSGRFLAKPVLINNEVFVANNAGAIYQIDLSSLEVVGQHQLPDRVPNGLSYDPNNKIYYAHTCDDRLFAFVKDE